MEHNRVKTDNKLTRHTSVIDLNTDNNESLNKEKIPIKKRKLDNIDPLNVSKLKNKPLQMSRQAFIEENKNLDSVIYYFEKGNKKNLLCAFYRFLKIN